MSARDTLDAMLLQEIKQCCERVEKISAIVHNHSGIMKSQNIILTFITLAILGISIGIITDWIKKPIPVEKVINQQGPITKKIER